MEGPTTDNPFGPLYQGAFDQAIVWAVVLAFTAVSAARARSAAYPAESRLQGASRAFVKLASATLVTFTLGAIGAALRISSAVWIVWQLAFLVSTIAVFWVFPVLLLALLLWGTVGGGRVCYSKSARRRLLLMVGLELGSVGTYFVLNQLMREQL
jgi:hypothetical protein